ILQCYYWPGMDRDINDFIKSCVKCQQRVKNNKTNNTSLQPLPQCSAPNQRIHADLFGPLKTSGSGKKYILCITDSMTKYVELVALPDKEAQTVAEAMFNRWICRYGSPLQITTDGGKEFCSKLSDRLYELMKIDHLTTSPYHPQCNSQAEIVNKTIAKYLSSFVDQTTLDWETYLPPLMFAYNTSMHSTTKFSPFFLTFGQKPRAPHFPSPDLTRTFYGESTIDEMWLKLQQARKIAIANNEEVRDNYEQNFNDKVIPIKYSVGQQVFLDEHNFLNKNRKLAPKFSGPHVIQKLLNDTNAQIKLKNGRSTIVHLNRLKPFLSQNEQIVENDTFSQNQNQQIIPFDIDETPPLYHTFCKDPKLLPTLPSPPQTQPIPAKRGRGRPKKSVTLPSGETETPHSGQIEGTPSDPPLEPAPSITKRLTRSQLQQMSETEKSEYYTALNTIKKFSKSVKNKNKSEKDKNNKKKSVKNGTTIPKWSKTQRRAFTKYGDVYGPTIKGNESVVDPQNPDPVAHPPQEDGEPEGDGEHQEDPNSSESDSENDSNPSSESEEELFEDVGHPDQEGGQPHEDAGAAQAPQAQAPGAQPGGHLPPLLQEQLPILQGPQGPQPEDPNQNPVRQDQVPPPPIQLPGPPDLPAGAQYAPQNIVPPPVVRPLGPDDHQVGAGGQIIPQQAEAAPPQQMGRDQGAIAKTPKGSPIREAEKEIPKLPSPTVAHQGRPKPGLHAHQGAHQQSAGVKLMAELVGISPTKITKQARAELLGDIVGQAVAGALPKMARIRSNPNIQRSPDHYVGGASAAPRAKTPELSPRETTRKSGIKTLEETKARIARENELIKAGHKGKFLSETDKKPTRSTYKAPDIPPLPSVPLERQKRTDYSAIKEAELEERRQIVKVLKAQKEAKKTQPKK
ncbi:DDE-type integrase/transposase/recombinase, partial [Aeromonas sobria]|uniref:DDE-type integrase/transposase/recombinase n=1 Tax=Aeromonas sobria TaxID=646 RepID=UPI003F38C29C